ncbi:protein NRT1/ PTR FAMILY 5.2 isoform X1 [Coffea arabica]|uniref:Protein NRT1/ PTR FAMILY 5.2-like isoform X1 n=1 Tax=Coffea arabica TaxID=13443 RepID=A0A6P6WW11_COFAR|nr:protein NRT1/ PTR FAMILY 5.2-like isoform X1 [Coffea arabica]XP_027118856.1 protein NRT1/ PTR FAMILY 5.2-like isoform X1 [Coffea arabica]
MAMEDGISDYTQDGTVDLKGNPVLRSKRGRWKACSFIVVYEVFERMAYCGISANLILYLTKKLHQGTVTASNNVTYWIGTIWLTPILGAYVADAYLGRYWTFVIACAIYLSGMCLLTLAVSVPGFRPPPCHAANVSDCPKATTLELAVFYTALYILAVGTGGTKPNISTIGADQFDDFDPKEKIQKLSFFNWWMFSIFFGILFGNTVLVYIQDNVGWALGYGIPTAGLALSIAIFLFGTPFYRHKKPAGSPFTKMARVIVATVKKWRVPVPTHPKELYELDAEEYTKKGKFKIESTTTLRYLNKAAVQTGSTSMWMLCSVTEVEETKQMLKMLPILMTTFLPNVIVAQSNTLFIKQGTTLDRGMGKHFKLPPASLGAFVTVTMLLTVVLYDRVFVKNISKWTKNPRGITLLQRLGLGFVLHIIIMIVASLTERHRLNVAKEHGLDQTGGQLPLTIFILLPQFILTGVADAMTEVARLEFFYDQAPESMKSLGTSFSMTSVAGGNFLSSFILSAVSRITREGGHKGWIQNNLNTSRLDLYFAFLAVVGFLNFLFFLVVTKFFHYKAEISDSMEVLKEELEGSRKDAYQVELADNKR